MEQLLRLLALRERKEVCTNLGLLARGQTRAERTDGLLGRGAGGGQAARAIGKSNIDSKRVRIDGERLAELLFDQDVGDSTVTRYRVKRIDNDFFLEE